MANKINDRRYSINKGIGTLPNRTQVELQQVQDYFVQVGE